MNTELVQLPELELCIIWIILASPKNHLNSEFAGGSGWFSHKSLSQESSSGPENNDSFRLND